MQPKFRAQLTYDHPFRDLKKGDWVFGFYLEDLKDGEWKSFIFCDCTYYEVDKKTLGQFTGFLDGNKNPIYEPLANRWYLCEVIGDYFINPKLLKIKDGNS